MSGREQSRLARTARFDGANARKSSEFGRGRFHRAAQIMCDFEFACEREQGVAASRAFTANFVLCGGQKKWVMITCALSQHVWLANLS